MKRHPPDPPASPVRRDRHPGPEGEGYRFEFGALSVEAVRSRVQGSGCKVKGKLVSLGVIPPTLLLLQSGETAIQVRTTTYTRSA